MGRDKALLPCGDGVLAQHVAARVRSAAGSAILIGDPDTYAHLGLPVVPDTCPGAGPLGGVHAALLHTRADWNLVVACDMPRITTEILLDILAAAERSQAGAVVPVAPSGLPEPACAAWHRSALAAVASALDRGIRKITDALSDLTVVWLPVGQVSYFQNVNTPEEWAGYAGG